MKKLIISLILVIGVAMSFGQVTDKKRIEDSLYINYCIGYIRACIDYDYNSRNTNPKALYNIDSIISRKKGNCRSFAVLFRHYLDLNIDPKDKNIRYYQFLGNTHIANVVYFYGKWYFFDVGWGMYWREKPSDYLKNGTTFVPEVRQRYSFNELIKNTKKIIAARKNYTTIYDSQKELEKMLKKDSIRQAYYDSINKKAVRN